MCGVTIIQGMSSHLSLPNLCLPQMCPGTYSFMILHSINILYILSRSTSCKHLHLINIYSLSISAPYQHLHPVNIYILSRSTSQQHHLHSINIYILSTATSCHYLHLQPIFIYSLSISASYVYLHPIVIYSLSASYLHLHPTYITIDKQQPSSWPLWEYTLKVGIKEVSLACAHFIHEVLLPLKYRLFVIGRFPGGPKMLT